VEEKGGKNSKPKRGTIGVPWVKKRKTVEKGKDEFSGKKNRGGGTGANQGKD